MLRFDRQDWVVFAAGAVAALVLALPVQIAHLARPEIRDRRTAVEREQMSQVAARQADLSKIEMERTLQRIRAEREDLDKYRQVLAASGRIVIPSEAVEDPAVPQSDRLKTYPTSSEWSFSKAASGPPPAPEEQITPLKQQDAPFLPWPPLEPSSSDEVTSHFTGPTYADVNRRISARLDSAGYGRWWYFSVPDGFAMATPLERVDQSGRPAPEDERWAAGKALFRGGLGAYFKRVMKGDSARFRMLVFVVSPHKLQTSADPANETDVRRWTTTGRRSLSDDVSQVRFGASHVFLFVYEFTRTRGRDAALAQDRNRMLPFRLHAASLGIPS